MAARASLLPCAVTGFPVLPREQDEAQGLPELWAETRRSRAGLGEAALHSWPPLEEGGFGNRGRSLTFFCREEDAAVLWLTPSAPQEASGALEGAMASPACMDPSFHYGKEVAVPKSQLQCPVLGGTLLPRRPLAQG